LLEPYNQLKLANDILSTIPENTEDPTLIVYKAQAKAVRAFDLLSLVPYYQFKYKGNETKPSVPIITNLMNSFYIENSLNDSLFNNNEKKLSSAVHIVSFWYTIATDFPSLFGNR
jgi:hypothetical protein